MDAGRKDVDFYMVELPEFSPPKAFLLHVPVNRFKRIFEKIALHRFGFLFIAIAAAVAIWLQSIPSPLLLIIMVALPVLVYFEIHLWLKVFCQSCDSEIGSRFSKSKSVWCEQCGSLLDPLAIGIRESVVLNLNESNNDPYLRSLNLLFLFALKAEVKCMNLNFNRGETIVSIDDTEGNAAVVPPHAGVGYYWENILVAITGFDRIRWEEQSQVIKVIDDAITVEIQVAYCPSQYGADFRFCIV
jgi:hypothetical protein